MQQEFTPNHAPFALDFLLQIRYTKPNKNGFKTLFSRC